MSHFCAITNKSIENFNDAKYSRSYGGHPRFISSEGWDFLSDDMKLRIHEILVAFRGEINPEKLKHKNLAVCLHCTDYNSDEFNNFAYGSSVHWSDHEDYLELVKELLKPKVKERDHLTFSGNLYHSDNIVYCFVDGEFKGKFSPGNFYSICRFTGEFIENKDCTLIDEKIVNRRFVEALPEDMKRSDVLSGLLKCYVNITNLKSKELLVKLIQSGCSDPERFKSGHVHIIVPKIGQATIERKYRFRELDVIGKHFIFFNGKLEKEIDGIPSSIVVSNDPLFSKYAEVE